MIVLLQEFLWKYSKCYVRQSILIIAMISSGTKLYQTWMKIVMKCKLVDYWNKELSTQGIK